MYCKNCGKILQNNEAICRKCGTVRDNRRKKTARNGKQRNVFSFVTESKLWAVFYKKRKAIGITAAVLAIVIVLQLASPGWWRRIVPPIHGVQAGDVVSFGDHNWRVLDVQGHRALVVTDEVVDFALFHEISQDVTWETSHLRWHLNNTFLDTFSASEKRRIIETYVVNSDNPWDFTELGGHEGTPGGSNTFDRVFLLSLDEVLRYFGDSGFVEEGSSVAWSVRSGNAPIMPSWGVYGWGVIDQYSESRAAFDTEGTPSWWWLRSPGHAPNAAVSVLTDGHLYMSGFDVFWVGGDGGGVRPAMWLYLRLLGN